MEKQRFWLYRRTGVFYLHDSETGKRESLNTRSRRDAQKIRNARNESSARPSIGLTMAKAYLSAQDPNMLTRTWEEVMNRFCSRGLPRTQDRRHRTMSSKPFELIKRRKLLETTAEDFLNVLNAGGNSAQLSSAQNAQADQRGNAGSNAGSGPGGESRTRPLRDQTGEFLENPDPNPDGDVGFKHAWIFGSRQCRSLRRQSGGRLHLESDLYGHFQRLDRRQSRVE